MVVLRSLALSLEGNIGAGKTTLVRLLQAEPLQMQSSHLSAQGIVFAQQRLHVAGDTFTMLWPIAIITR